MRNAYKRWLTLLLACALLLTAALPAALAEGDDREMVGNMYTEGLPIVQEKESFSLLTNTSADPYEMELFKRFEEETNIAVEWMAYPYDIAAEKEKLMYSSGDMPDAVGGWLVSKDDIMRYGANEGLYIPIEDYIRDYAPRMTYCLDNFPNGRSSVTTPNGHIYSMALMAPQPITGNVVLINQKWLDTVGMPMPQSVEAFYEVLKAFREGDPNGNGKPDEIPFSTPSGELKQVLSWFGLADNNQHIGIKDGELLFVPATENYKEGMKYLAMLFSEKLIDQENFTHSDDQFKAKGKEEHAVLGSFLDWSGPGVVGQERFDTEYAVLPPLSSKMSPEPVWGQGDDSVFPTQLAITNSAKNPAMIVRWADHLYQEDNSIQVMKGPYGALIERNDDGSFAALEPPEGENMDSYRNKLSITSLPYCIMPDVLEQIPISAFEQNKKDADDIYAPFITKEPIPPYWITPEESAEVATLAVDIEKYVQDMLAAWVSGQSDVEADWEGYLQQLNNLGLEQYMQVMTTAVMR